MTGVVQSIKKFRHKSYGWIKGVDQKVYYFNSVDCNDFQTYEKGDSVEFEVLGEKAINVSKCTV